MRSWISLLSLIALVLFSACDHGPVGPTVPLNEHFTLAPGTSALVQGARLSVAFLRVSGDSRCPADALCIQGGDAIVHVRATSTSTMDYELHTGDAARASVSHSGFRIALTEVQPYPFSSRTIDPGDYRATFVVSR